MLVLDQLEGADGAAELLAFGGVGQGVLVGATGAPHRHPGDPGRVIRSTAAVSRNVVARCSRLASGTRTPSRVIRAFCTACNAILSCRVRLLLHQA